MPAAPPRRFGGRGAGGERRVVLEFEVEATKMRVHVRVHQGVGEHASEHPLPPKPLVEQLVPGGRLVIPVGSRDDQVLTLVTRHTEGAGFDSRPVHDVRFVPLLGEFGFTAQD